MKYKNIDQKAKKASSLKQGSKKQVQIKQFKKEPRINDRDDPNNIQMKNLLGELGDICSNDSCVKHYLDLISDQNDDFIIQKKNGPKGGIKTINLKINMLKNNKEIMFFLLGILEESWVNSPSIDIYNFKITKEYICIKNEELLNILRSELNEDIKDDYKRVMETLIAIKFYLHKKELNVPMPSRKCDENTVLIDFEELKQAASSENEPRFVGRQAANFFMEGQRVKCALQSMPSLDEIFYSPRLVGRIANFIRSEGELNKSRFVTKLFADFVPTQFRPVEVPKLINRLEKEFHVKIHNYFNPCGGWGDRLTGAMATKDLVRYIETDPNTNLLPIKLKMVEKFNTMGFGAQPAEFAVYLGPVDPTKSPKQIYLYPQPVESLTEQQCAPNGEKNDLVFFSPPYFDMEKYPDQERTQSHVRYKKLDDWFENFLIKCTKTCYKSLKINGFFAINIDVITVGKQRIDLPNMLKNNEFVQNAFDFMWEYTYAESSRNNHAKQSMNNVSLNNPSPKTANMVYVFRSKEMIVNPPNSPEMNFEEEKEGDEFRYNLKKQVLLPSTD